jgi:xanthine dehydrogenase accessory factor
MDLSQYYAELSRLLNGQEAVWQITIIAVKGSTPAKPGMKIAVPLNGKEFGNIGGGSLEHMAIQLVRDERPSQPVMKNFVLSENGDQALADDGIPTGMICGGEVCLFIEALGLLKPLFIIGAGHCGKALGELAMRGGYRVTLIDNRPEIISSDLSSYCHKAFESDYSDIGSVIDFSLEASIVIMTHGHVHDAQVLEYCLERPCGYLGMIGSSKKARQTLDMLRQKGYPDVMVGKVRTPIGIPIGSQTPFEIAVSIMAELISVAKKG